ncbi:MAG: AarF/ABC1/UbiB kinase family protein [Pirellulaceae bacterium]|jgi:ubiquinone biosynthesis protein|nr:AarF/ABC1/UbiB kinase family protein [Thermoguttaceae bacterium]MDI9443029.1 AarF/ABC1/UbiB kinase family protein [Planctomycetota bacterium]NLZ03423.1 AarF/ABC1/UbiB kinase family protein [Pirellulaceae bacterium]
MRISSIPQLYRHINRWREIVAVLSRYGLAEWINRLGPEFAKDFLKAPGGTAIARHAWETRLRLAFSELGPTFIKLGQFLSTRPDMVGVTLAGELQRLQTDVTADPPEVVVQALVLEFGHPIEEAFSHFEEYPIASASIGQVHRARLKTGEEVVVKVQHAGIERKVSVDLDILSGLAQIAERIPEFANYRPVAMAAEFRRVFRDELDFTREARNMQQFARELASNPTVHIPRCYAEWTTSRVLTMEFVDGIKLIETDRLAEAGLDLEEIARRGATLYLDMIFDKSFYHADPHPGNALVMPGNVIALLDFGMVGRIDERLQSDIEEMLLAVMNQDPEYLTSIITRVGSIPAEFDRAALSVEVADFVSLYANQSLDQFDLSGALNDLTEMIRRYHISLPARIAMLIKVLVTLEGTSRLLSPRFSLAELMRPYRRQMILRRLSPGRKLRKMRRFYAQLEYLVELLPRSLVEILEQVQSGQFDVHLDHRGLEPSVNRLVAGMLASALFLGSSLLVSQDVPPLLGDLWLFGRISLISEISLPGVIGVGLSIVFGLRLWRAISKSGHLDRRH